VTSEGFEREDADLPRDVGEAATRRGDGPLVGDDFDYDAAFAALVQQFNADTAPEATAPEATEPEPVPEPAVPWQEAVLDEHYEPEDPAPLPSGDLPARLAWAAVLGGPLVLIVASVVEGDPPGWLVVASVLAFIGGFVALVARMPAERDDDDDDGAVV
jgi:hypothetical protein